MSKMKNGVVKRGRTWSYVIRVPDHRTGMRKSKWVGGFKTHALAKAARDEALGALRSGSYVAPDGQTLGDYLLTWLGAKDATPKTVDGYRYHVEHYVNPRIGAIRLQEVTPLLLTRLYADLRADGGRNGQALGWASLRGISATLSSALTAAEQLGVIGTSPAKRALLPPRPSHTTRADHEAMKFRVFSADEVRTFTAHAVEAHRLGAFFHLAAFSGARRGELLHLRWPDLDFDGHQLHIRGSRGVVAGEVLDGPTKTKRSRTVSLDPSTVSVMRAHRQAQLEERLKAGEVWDDSDNFIFRRTTGEGIWPESPTQLMPKLCASAGVPRRKLHELRHTHATILLNAGEPVHEVANRLGHADVHETLNTYARIVEVRQNRLGDSFAAALAGSHPGS